MSLIDAIQGQLSGEVTKGLGGLIGVSESDLKKISTAGIPALLSGLGAVASSKSGSEKLAKSIEGLDPSLFDNLGKALGGGALSKGGDLLGGLLGGTVTDGLASAIAKYTGLPLATIKSAINYLVPIVLAAVGSSFKGGSVNAAGISKLFADNKSSIASALPSGLSLDSIPGFQSLVGNVSGAVSSAAKAVPEVEQNGLGKILISIACVLALLFGGYLLYERNKTLALKEAQAAAAAVKAKADAAANEAKKGVDSAIDALNDETAKAKAALGNLNSLKDGLAGTFDSVFKKLEGVTDVASAEAAVPSLTEAVTKLDGFAALLGKIPAEGKGLINGLVKSQLDKLNPLIEKISEIPGIGDAIKQLLLQLKEKLVVFAG